MYLHGVSTTYLAASMLVLTSQAISEMAVNVALAWQHTSICILLPACAHVTLLCTSLFALDIRGLFAILLIVRL